MFLEYLALAMLLLSLVALFYLFIFIHDLPARTAKKRHHPHEEAIHYACWLSLFTLHAIWPLVYLWAVSNRNAALKVAIAQDGAPVAEEAAALRREIADLKQRLAALEAKPAPEGKAA